jgi:hypothetical protein
VILQGRAVGCEMRDFEFQMINSFASLDQRQNKELFERGGGINTECKQFDVSWRSINPIKDIVRFIRIIETLLFFNKMVRFITQGQLV